MKMKYFALILMVFAASCAPKIKNFDSYQKQFMSKSEFLPDKESLEGKPAKIVVFALNENDNETAVQAKLGVSVANGVENIISQNRLAKLVDRSVASKLQKEVQLAELNKTGAYKGPQVADYAISGAISNAAFEKKYTDGSTYFNPKTGAVTTIPPKFTYSAGVEGNIKIYALPSMSVVDNIEFKGHASRQEDVQQNGGLSLGSLRIGGQQAKGIDRDDGLVRSAGMNAIKNLEVDLKNALAPKGYILEKRVLEDKTIFKISLGNEQGIKHGDKFEIYGEYETQNPITGDTEVERRKIGEGAVADIINPKYSWVVIKNGVEKIRLGDIVKMKYKKGFF